MQGLYHHPSWHQGVEFLDGQLNKAGGHEAIDGRELGDVEGQHAQYVKNRKDSYDLHNRGPKKDQAFQVNTESARFIFRTEIGYILKRRLI